VMLTSLMEAADRVDSTTGLQMAYLKAWAPRASRPLELRVPDVLPRAGAGKGAAVMMEAVDAAASLDADVAYVDPPYNQHSYLGNYHIWETLVRWDRPEVYGIACKRVDCMERRSAFNSRRTCFDALSSVIRALRAPTVIVSFSDEGYVGRESLEALLREVGGADAELRVLATDYPRYVGARIGIYNPKGVKVGAVGRLRNTEYLYILRRAGVQRSRSSSEETPSLAQRPCAATTES
ncbi:MAG: DNA adenine methylase, partial [Phycisphaerales bacterium]